MLFNLFVNVRFKDPVDLFIFIHNHKMSATINDMCRLYIADWKNMVIRSMYMNPLWW